MTSHELIATRHRQLAELLMSRDPWRAALSARRATAMMPQDDRAWAVLAMSQTLLGNYNCAVTAYEHALAIAPENPSYAHNMGHVLDRRLGRHVEALAWLRVAYEGSNRSGDVAMSLVHALGSVGLIDEAKCALTDAMTREGAIESCEPSEFQALWRWLDDGAPRHERVERRAPVDPSKSATKKQRSGGQHQELEALLSQELRNLPFDRDQCAHALALGHAALSIGSSPGGDDLRTLAAAAAYSVAYLEDIPLSPSDVAASFRIGTARLRGRFEELRAGLLLNRGRPHQQSRAH